MDLFAYVAGKTDTSREAAASLRPRMAPIRDRVAALLREHPGGLTTEEISGHLRIPYASVQPRTSELQALGKVEDSGARRLNGSGKRAIVWRWCGDE